MGKSGFPSFGWESRGKSVRIGDKALVCTFFVGLDLNSGNGEPLLYMTDVYGSELVNGRFYETKKEALKGHWEIVTGVEEEHGIDNPFARLFPQPGDPGLPTLIWRGISAGIRRVWSFFKGERNNA